MYGYEITQRVKEISQEKILLTEGALYPALHKLEAGGLVETEVVSLGRRVRKYYRLTPIGRTEAKFRVQEFTDFVKTMSRVLNLRWV
jgi:DNA-binding PadR family transcriptional regulator